jgi:hypothetical protein
MALLSFFRSRPRSCSRAPIALPPLHLWRDARQYPVIGQDLAPWQALVSAAAARQQTATAMRR